MEEKSWSFEKKRTWVRTSEVYKREVVDPEVYGGGVIKRDENLEKQLEEYYEEHPEELGFLVNALSGVTVSSEKLSEILSRIGKDPNAYSNEQLENISKQASKYLESVAEKTFKSFVKKNYRYGYMPGEDEYGEFQANLEEYGVDTGVVTKENMKKMHKWAQEAVKDNKIVQKETKKNDEENEKHRHGGLAHSLYGDRYIAHSGRSVMDGAKIGSGRYRLGSGNRPYQAYGGNKEAKRLMTEGNRSRQLERLKKKAKILQASSAIKQPASGIARSVDRIRKTKKTDNTGKEVKNLSTSELRERVNRLNLERQYADLMKADAAVSKGEIYVREALNIIGDLTAIGLTAYSAYQLARK